jgi:hypothetical protein
MRRHELADPDREGYGIDGLIGAAWSLVSKVIQFMAHPDLTKEARDEAKLVRRAA